MLPLAKPDIARTLFALRSIACACFSRIFCAVFRCFLFCLLLVLVFSSAASSSELFFFGFFSSESSSFCFRLRRLSFERNPFISSRALERRNVYVVVVEEARDDDFPRALLTHTTPPQCEKKPNEKQRCFSRNTVERVRFCLARRQKDLSGERCVPNERHAHTTTTPNRFRIKSQRRGKMFDEFFPQTKKQSRTLSSRA